MKNQGLNRLLKLVKFSDSKQRDQGVIQEGGAGGGFSTQWASSVCSLEEEEGCRQGREGGMMCRGSRGPRRTCVMVQQENQLWKRVEVARKNSKSRHWHANKDSSDRARNGSANSDCHGERLGSEDARKMLQWKKEDNSHGEGDPSWTAAGRTMPFLLEEEGLYMCMDLELIEALCGFQKPVSILD
ncbi:hypothetical protein U0070_026589, partial [Myodes glareolus]